MTSSFHQASDAVIFGCVETWSVDHGPGSIGENTRGRLSSERRFADAFLSGEQPGVMKRTPPPSRSELIDRPILADDHGSRSPSASISFAVTFSGEPDALTSRTRSGSVAAIVRKAVSTLR